MSIGSPYLVNVSYLYRMKPRLCTSNSFHSCDGQAMHGAERSQAGIDGVVTA